MNTSEAAQKLAELYGLEFGGKKSGRYRLPQKLLRDLLGKKRLYPEDIVSLTRDLFEEGYVLIDMDNYFVVMSANSFVNYRRAGRNEFD
ncbi:hypothetical protein [Roseibium sp. M-1]